MAEKWFVRYEKWAEAALAEFRTAQPQYAGISGRQIEISDDGTVTVHAGGAYPLVFRGAVTPYTRG